MPCPHKTTVASPTDLLIGWAYRQSQYNPTKEHAASKEIEKGSTLRQAEHASSTDRQEVWDWRPSGLDLGGKKVRLHAEYLGSGFNTLVGTPGNGVNLLVRQLLEPREKLS